MSAQIEVCRVVKRDTLYGTFYLPQRRVYKTRWFRPSGYEWEYFTYEEYYILNELRKTFQKFYFIPEHMSGSALKDPAYADRVCKRYMEVEYGDKTIKTWSIDE